MCAIVSWMPSFGDLRQQHDKPFPGFSLVDVQAFRKAMLPQEMPVWQGLQMAPSRHFIPCKLCTYFRWFARPDRMLVEPYNEFHMSILKLRLLFHFRMGSHLLPVGQSLLARPGVPGHLRSCTFCPDQALGDEWHCIFDCPHFGGLGGHWLSFARLCDDAHGAMQALSVAQKPEGCLCSYIGHLYRGLE